MKDVAALPLSEEQIMDRLLNAETVPERTKMLTRLGIPITFRAVTAKQVFAIQERCTDRKNNRLDNEQFNAAIIVAATVSPNWSDSRLLAQFKASGPEEVVKRILLAGEMDMFGDEIMDLSGYNNGLEDIKN